MAKVFAPPKEVGPPPSLRLDYRTYQAQQEAWVDKLRSWVKANGDDSDLCGRIVSFPVADGFAQYMVLRKRPLGLVHLPLGDAYQFRYAHLLNVKEIYKLVARNDS